MADRDGLRFTESHEWARQEGDGATVGISDYAQSQLGDVIYLELPSVGQRLEAGARFGVIESVKAASDLYSPLAGEVAEVNEALKEHPEYVNEDPYGKGWILKLRAVSANPRLLDEAGYKRLIGGAEPA
jgi:glycine cleavage system H protein